MARWIGVLRELDARDALFLLRAGTLASAVPALVRALPLPTAMRLIDASAVHLPIDPPPPERMVRLTDQRS